MFVRKLLILCAIAVAAVLQPVWSQDGKITVSLEHSGDDSIGSRLAFALREAIRSSSGYRLVADNAVLRISLVTLDPERSAASTGLWTAAAIAYTMRNDLPLDNKDPQTWYPIYLSTSVVIAGSSRVEDQAKGILAGLDKQVEIYRRAMRGN